MADHLKEGQQVRVKVLEADEKGRLRLSMKALTEPPKKEEVPPAPAPEGAAE
jgi:polyribonucleotide nucleotidyltransferase